MPAAGDFTAAPNTPISLSAAGTFRAAFVATDATFRGDLVNQLLMQGLTVQSVSLSTDWGFWDRSYTATIVVRPLSALGTETIANLVRLALQNAGSEPPAVTVTSAGQPAQQPPPSSLFGDTIEDVLEATGAAARNIADAPKDLTNSVNLIVLGIVALGLFLAFGPNVKTIASKIP